MWIEPCRSNDPDQTRLDRDQFIKARAITMKELRKMHGLPAIAGGDVLVSPQTPPGPKSLDLRPSLNGAP